MPTFVNFSTIKLLDEVYRKLARTMSEAQCARVYEITMVCHVLIATGLRSEAIAPHQRRALRTLRTDAFDLMRALFAAFQHRTFGADELHVLCSRVIESHIVRQSAFATPALTAKGVAAAPIEVPWAITRFFCALTTQPRFHPLLNVQLAAAAATANAKRRDADAPTPTSLMCACLSSTATDLASQLVIVEAFVNLLTYVDKTIADDAALPTPRQRELTASADDDATTFGTCLTIQHASELLRYLQASLPVELSVKGRAVAAKLTLLERLSEYVDDAAMGAEFASMLLGFVERGQLRNEERLAAVLNAVGNFVAQDAAPADYLARLTPLFDSLRARRTRTALVGILQQLRRNSALDAELQPYLKSLVQLEAWSKTRINEPDYELRTIQIAELTTLYKHAELIPPLVVRPLVHSHFFTLTHVDEIGIRATISSCLTQFVSYARRLTRSPQPTSAAHGAALVRDDVMPLVRRALRSQNESVRHEAVALLATLIDEFCGSVASESPPPPPHDALQQLSALRNADDPEVCFFENVAHLQLHRRQRAFARLAQRLQEGKTGELEFMSLNVLNEFIIPLVRPYLLRNEDKYTALSDEAVHLFAEIVRRQPAETYMRTLIGHINALGRSKERVKPEIRVLAAVLDAFSFDVSTLQLPRTAFEVPHKRRARARADDIDDDAAAAANAAAAERVEQPPNLIALSLNEDEAVKSKQADEAAVEGESQHDDTEANADDAEEEEAAIEDADDGARVRTEAKSAVKVNEAEALADTLELSKEQRILATVLRVIVPRLRECIRPTKDFLAHKKAQKGDKFLVDDEEIDRAPVALATVRLLKKLPTWAMDLHLQGVLLTLMQLLLSRAFYVRQAARKTMENVVHALGPAYLPRIVRELRQKFTRGYQVHVMIYTVHCLVAALQHVLETGNLDTCLDDIYAVVKLQQFGETEEERQVTSIRAKTPESKAAKAQETMALVGRFVSTERLPKLVPPLKQVIDETPNASTHTKLQELLRALSSGLRRNAGITPPTMADYAHSVLTAYVGEMSAEMDAAAAAAAAERRERDAGYRPSHALLLAPEPRRQGVLTKTSNKSKVSLFVEYGLQLLGDIVDAKHFDYEDESSIALLDRFLKPVIETLRLKYERISSVGLRALAGLLKYKLPSMEALLPTLADRLFVLLAEYASADGTTRLNVTELMQHLFKCFVVVVRHAPAATLSPMRLQILLNYVEADVLDAHKQATAFRLAKALIRRQIRDEKIDALVHYLADLSVTSPQEMVREQCRSTLQTYFRSHPDGALSMERWLRFFLDQLDYEFVHGRLSALETVHALFALFNESVTDRLGLVTFVRLASRFLEETNDECRACVAAAVRELIASVSDSVRHQIHGVVLDWLESAKEAPRTIGARALAELVKMAEYKMDVKQTRKVLKCLCRSLAHVDLRVMKANEAAADDGDAEEGGSDGDDVPPPPPPTANAAIVDSALALLIELTRNRINALEAALRRADDAQRTLAEALPRLLVVTRAAPVVAAAAATLLELLLAAAGSLWPLLEGHVDLDALCAACLRQLNAAASAAAASAASPLTLAMAETAVKNLVALSVHVDEATFEQLCEALAVSTRKELRRDAGITRRVNLFKFFAAQLVHYKSGARFDALVRHVSPAIFRELHTHSTRPHAEQLAQIAGELGAELSRYVGADAYAALLADYHTATAKRAAVRKRERRELAISEPVRATRLKQQETLRKASAKKRKIDERRPYRVQKRQRVEDAKRTAHFALSCL